MKKVLYIIIAIVLVAALGIGGAVYWTNANNYVAKVGQEKITKAEYNFFLSSIKNQMETLAGQDVAAFWNSKFEGQDAREYAKNKALEETHNFKIQLIKAKENGISLTKEEENTINSNIDEQVKQIGGRVKADEELKGMYNINVREYKAIARDITIVQKFISDQQEKKKPTDEQLSKYYEDNKDKLEQVTVRHVLLSIKDENNQVLAEDKKQEKKKKAEDVLAKVKAGEDIGALAKEYSEDPGSKDSNGEYTFERGRMVKEFEDWAFSAKEGDVGLVTTEHGYHVMKLMKKLTFEDVKESVASSYAQDDYEKQMEEWKKDANYNVIKNQKVYDSISVS